jgi:hypothetical protein
LFAHHHQLDNSIIATQRSGEDAEEVSTAVKEVAERQRSRRREPCRDLLRDKYPTLLQLIESACCDMSQHRNAASSFALPLTSEEKKRRKDREVGDPNL